MRKGSGDGDSLIRADHQDRARVVGDKLKAGEEGACGCVHNGVHTLSLSLTSPLHVRTRIALCCPFTAEGEVTELLEDVADDISRRQMYVMRESLEAHVRRIESKDTELRSFNFSVMAAWVGTNMVLAAALEAITSGRETFLAIIFSVAAFTLAIQVVGSVFYVLERTVRCAARRWRFRRRPASAEDVDVERAAGGGVDMRPVAHT